MSHASRSRLRIVLVEPSLEDNGALRVSLDRARRWQQAGNRVTLFVVHHSPAGQTVLAPTGMRVRRATTKPLRFLWTAVAGGLRLLLLAVRADVVVAGREVHMGLLFGWAAARLTRRPLAVTVQSRADTALQEYVDDRLRAVTGHALRTADLAVCVSADVVGPATDVGVPAGRTRVVTNGVDVAGIRRAAEAEPEVALPDGPFIAASGRLHRQKGFDLLLRAHAVALDGGAPPHHLMVAGDGPDRAALQALADALGISDSVLFLGFVPNPHPVVARSSLFVLPSRWEGYPLALVEAVCLGVACISADCVAGPREVLDDGRYGRLVPVEDPVALAAAVAAHLHDPTHLRGRAQAGAAAAHQRFDPDAAARRHLELLSELAAGGPSAGRRRADRRVTGPRLRPSGA